MEKDKKMLVTLKGSIHKRLKIESARSGESMNLIINQTLDKELPKQ